MLQQILVLLTLVVLPSVEAVISAQDPTSPDLTSNRVGVVRDVPPDPTPSNVTPFTRWRSFSAEAQQTFKTQPGTLLSDFIDLGCVSLGTQALELLSINCTEITNHGGSRAHCTAGCAEFGRTRNATVSASTFMQGPGCFCCLTDAVLHAAVLAEETRCDLACSDQDKSLFDLQPLQAQRRFSSPWSCGGAGDAWSAFRQHDGVSPLGRRGAFSPLFNAWYEVVVLPADVIPRAAEAATQEEGNAGAEASSSTPSGQWMEFPGMAFFLHAVHAGLGWPIWSHQGRLSFVPECLHVDDRGRLMALARKNSRLDGVQPGFDALAFEMCGAGQGQPQVVAAVDGFDASITGCTFDIERAVMAFVAKPFGGQTQVSTTPRLVEVDVVRLGVTSKEVGSLDNIVSLEQCRQMPGGASPASLAALVVSPGEFTMLPPQTLASDAQAVDSLGECGNEPGTDACKMNGPDREVLQMHASAGHPTLPFMHVATELAAYFGAEYEDEASAQIAKIPCQPGGGQAELFPSSVPSSHRRRGAYIEAPQNTFPRQPQPPTTPYCARSMSCTLTIDGVGVTGDDHILSYPVSQMEATTALCDLAALSRSISAGGGGHIHFRHEEDSQRWTGSPVYTGVSFDLPGFHLLCYYVVPACTGNLTHAIFGGIQGQNLGAIQVMGPELDQRFFCIAYVQCALVVKGWFFDAPVFAYLGQDETCSEKYDGDPAEPWEDQPWQFHLAIPASVQTRLDIPIARPMEPKTICYCLGATDPAQASFLGRCTGPGQPFGNVSAAYPDTENTWIIPGNFLATDPPSEFQFQGSRLVYTNRLVIIPTTDPPDEKPCRGSNMEGRHWLKPTSIANGFMVFRVHSLTPDAAFLAYGMPRDYLQLSDDGMILRSSFLKAMEFHVCYTDASVPMPPPDGLLIGKLILEASICGDGILRRPERCDDGNTNSGDGCNEFCAEIEAGWEMLHEDPEVSEFGQPGGPVLVPVCGDGLERGSETCDDNNLASGDGCSVTCAVEPGWTCTWEEGLLRSVCIPICGDYVRVPGVEECDDGNNVGGDGCSPGCVVETGFECQDEVVTDAALGLVDQEMSVCEVACTDTNNIAAMASLGIFPCMDGLRPPETAGPHTCTMFPRRCAGMPFYNGDSTRWLGCTDEVERIKAQCALIAQPSITGIRYTRSGAGLVVTFSEQARVTVPAAGQGSCDIMFASASSVLGEGASCTQSSDTSLEVTFGGKAALRPGVPIIVLAGAIYLASEPIAARTGTPEWPANWPPVSNAQATVTTEFPLGGFEPLVALLTSQPRLGLGADVELDASSSSGGGGNLAYSWGVKSVTLNQIWLDGFYAGNTQLHQTVLNIVSTLLQEALDQSANEPVALVPADVIMQIDTELRKAGGLLGQGVEILDPVIITFKCTVTSNFDGQVQEATWGMEVFQFAIPLVVRDSPVSQTINRDLPVSMVGKITAPAGLQPSQLPPYALQWSASRFNIGVSTEVIDVSSFVGQNPGVLTIPGLTFQRGTWTFYLSCTYTAGTETSVITTQFQVTFDATQPIARLDAPPSASAACNTSLSGSRSFDPGFTIPGTKTPLTPLPNASYKMEWRCMWLGEGIRVMTANEQVLVGLEATGKNCEDVASIPPVRKGRDFFIPANAFAGNTVVLVRMRLVPTAGKVSAWVSQRIKFLDYVIPAVTFPQMPVSPFRTVVPQQVWALSVSSLGCPQTGGMTLTLMNVGSGQLVPNMMGGEPPVELVQSYQGLDSLPAEVRTKVLANVDADEGDPYADSILNTYWIRVRALAMTPGNKYRLYIHGDPGIWSVESPIMEANAGPRGGQLTVRPTQGEAVQTSFRLTATGYEDPHIPLSFIFWTRAMQGEVPVGPLEILSDWATTSSLLVPMPAGNWTVICRARDVYGMESAAVLDHTFGPVSVLPASVSSEDSIDRVSTMSERITDSTQLMGAVSTVLDAFLPTQTSARRRLQDGNSSNASNATLDPGVASALLNTLETGQKFQVGSGSKSGATKQATMLLGISTGIDGAPANDTNSTNSSTAGSARRLSSAAMAKKATNVLSTAFTQLEGAEDQDDPSGVTAEEATDYVKVSATLAVVEETTSDGSRRLVSRDLDLEDATKIAGVVDGVGRAMAQNRNHDGSSTPAVVQLDELVVVGASLPSSMTGSNAGGVSKLKLEGVGEFDLPQEALDSANSALAALGFSGETSVGISANQWKGNPFGPSTQCKNETADGGCNASNTVQASALSNVTSMSMSGAGGQASKVENLQNPIQFVLAVGQDVSGGPPPLCMWWDTTLKIWSTEGCQTLEVRKDGTEIVCSCTHLTSFGAFNDAGVDVIAGSNIDVLTDFDFEALQADNPTLWFVVSLFACQLVWVCLGVWADNHGYSGSTDEQLKKIYFEETADNAPPGTPKAEEQEEEAKEAKEAKVQLENNQKSVNNAIRNMFPRKGKNSPTEDLLHFRDMIKATLDHHHIHWMDLASKKVRDHVHGICKDEIKHALQNHYTEKKEEGGNQNLRGALLKAFRFELRHRLTKQMGRRKEGPQKDGKPKRRRLEPGLPTFPWTFSASVKLSCHGVHPLEEEPQVRKQLRVDEVLNVLVVADEFTVKVYIREGDFTDAECALQDPFLEMSWLTILDHEGILNDETVEQSGNEDRESRAASRVEQRATSALAVAAPAPATAFARRRVDTGAGVGDMCDEWEDEFLARHARGETGISRPRGYRRAGDRRLAQEARREAMLIDEDADGEAPAVEDYIRHVNNYNPWSDGETAAVVAPPQDDEYSDVSDDEGSFPRLTTQLSDPTAADMVQEEPRPYGFFQPLVDGIWGAVAGDEAVDRWEEGVLHYRTPRLAQQAALLGGRGGRGLEFWRSGGKISEVAGVPPELMRQAMLMLIQVTPPPEDGDMSWVTSGHYFSWAPLQTRELRRLQTQAHSAAAASRQPEAHVAPRVEVLICGLQPHISSELQVVVPKMRHRAKEEEENTKAKLARERRRRRATSPHSSDSEGSAAASSHHDDSGDSEDEEDARMAALEARWETPDKAEVTLLDRGPRKPLWDLDADPVEAEDVEGPVLVAIPDNNQSPMDASTVDDDLVWSVMHLSVEEDVANLNSSRNGKPAVLRFSDLYEGVPQQFTGWAVPMGRVSFVRVVRGQNYPLPALGGASIEQVQLAMEPSPGGRFDEDSSCAGSAFSDGGPLPDSCRELVELIVAPRDEPLYRILIRPLDDTADSSRLSSCLRSLVESWQQEEKLRMRPKLEELSRVGQLERQAEDLRKRAREAEDEARKDQLRKAERHAENLQQIDDCIDLLFRRYEFILWDPITLMRRVLMRDHPMTGIFVPRLRSFAVERALIFSCALAGSLMAAALFYDAGAGTVAPTTNTTANGTSTQDTVADTSTAYVNPWDQILRQVWVSALSVFIAGIPAGLIYLCFKRDKITKKLTLREQHVILRWWQKKRRIGYVISTVFLAFCYFFLWQFALNRPIDLQKNFTASSAINLVWKIVLKPVMLFIVVALLIQTVKVSAMFDAVMFLIPFSFLDFTMFTATDIDDLLVYEQLVSQFFQPGVPGGGEILLTD